ncbi:hypothetical protein BDF21DRAFT_430175 [Thamnidium elegans]|uniref:Uncharacterized protein n=1 Tax=Thamnidium elegans TaxID=101142 RepID=A0A8H7VTF2_9FUNG|nr:hypothetical protein INT48_005177 [Thamnidium elegans]KAI8058877.1 hypothetical protein BDF21DRAFT_430175 [Thamnidium elegans]
MLCDEKQSFTCPDTQCENVRFSVCGGTTNDNSTVIYDSCSDTSKLNCDYFAFESCSKLTAYVSTNGVNDTLPVGNQVAVCGLFAIPVPEESAATLNQANFILVLMFICLLTVSLSRKF